MNMVGFDSSLLLIVATLSMTMMSISAMADIKCAELKFLNAKNNVIHTNVETNITFSVRFENCSTDDTLIVKISEKMRERCKIIYNRSECHVSESSSSCSCSPVTGLTTFVTRLNETGNITYTWSWRFPGSEEEFREFTFLFSEHDAHNTTDRFADEYVLNMILVGSAAGSLSITVIASIIVIYIFCRKSADRDQMYFLPLRLRFSKRRSKYLGVNRISNSHNIETMKKTSTLPPPPTEWFDDCGAANQSQIRLGLKEQQVARQHQKVNDALFSQNFEMSLYTNHSTPPDEWSDPDYMSQD